MYVIFCVLCAIIGFAQGQFDDDLWSAWRTLHHVPNSHFPTDTYTSERRHFNNMRHIHPTATIPKQPNKYKLSGNTVCCCRSTLTPKSNFTKNDYSISLVNNNEAINCAEKIYPTNCHCFLNLSGTDVQTNVTENSCASTNVFFYIAVMAVILLIVLLICIVLLLRTKTGYKIDKYCIKRTKSNRRSLTIIRRSCNANSNPTFNDRSGDTVTRIKYDSLRNRPYSHIYHSLDNVHMATEDSPPATFINQWRYEKNPHYKLSKNHGIQIMSQRLSLNDSNFGYEEPIIPKQGADDHDINRRRPFPLPHENIPPANVLPKSNMVSSTQPHPPKKNFLPAPGAMRSPLMASTTPSTSELIQLFNKRRLNENEPLGRQNITQNSMALRSIPSPQQPNEVARTPASHFDNNEGDDWTYEEFVNVSIYNVK